MARDDKKAFIATLDEIEGVLMPNVLKTQKNCFGSASREEGQCVRLKKVMRLRREIAEGRYRVSAEALAESLMRHARAGKVCSDDGLRH